jgi:hypothetical protein
MLSATMDLFAEPASDADRIAGDEAGSAFALAREALLDDAEELLEIMFVSAGRKGALKALEPDHREALLGAVSVVSRAREAGYRRAAAGQTTDAFDWTSREPKLAAALASLHAVMLDTRDMPLSKAERAALS